MKVIPLRVEVHERDGKAEPTFRLGNDSAAANVELEPGDWVVLLTRVRRLRRSGGYRYSSTGVSPFGDGFSIVRFAPTENPEDDIRPELEFIPDSQETYFVYSGISDLVSAVVEPAEDSK